MRADRRADRRIRGGGSVQIYRSFLSIATCVHHSVKKFSVARFSHLAQILMDKLHRDRSFADSGSHSLNRAMAHVAHCEYPGNIRLQQKRIAFKRPSLGMLPISDQIRAGQQEATIVTLDQISQPYSTRQRSDKYEHGTGRNTLDL